MFQGLFMKFIQFFGFHAKMYTALVLLYYAMLDYFFHLKQKCFNSILCDCSKQKKQTNKQKKMPELNQYWS